MAHDRMTNDDLDRNMGRAGQEDDLGGGGQDFGRQTPGRNPQDQQTGQKGAGQHKNTGQEDDDEFGKGGKSGEGQMGRTPQGGQNR